MRLNDVPATYIAKPIQNDPTGFLEDYSPEVRKGLLERFIANHKIAHCPFSEKHKFREGGIYKIELYEFNGSTQEMDILFTECTSYDDL